MFQNFIKLSCWTFLISFVFTIGCSAQQNEEQALASLRELTRTGKLPPEGFVAGIESRFAGRRTGALAKLLRARIRFDDGDFKGAAALLNSDVFAKHTKLADHALWLRGRALSSDGDATGAMKVLAELVNTHPDSVRTRDARLLWASTAIGAGNAVDVPGFLVALSENNDADAMLLTAKAYEAQNSRREAIDHYRRAYFFAAGTPAAKEAEAKLTAMSEPLLPQTGAELLARADLLAKAKNFSDASSAYNELASRFPASMTPAVQLRRITAHTSAGKMADAMNAFNALPATAPEREDGYRSLVSGYAKARMWSQARTSADEMREKFPSGRLVAATFVDAGLAARDAKSRSDESYFLTTAVYAFPDAVEVAQAQFELAWMQHENYNYGISAQMLTDHLARYVDKDNTNRGKAGYWAARDSDRAGKMAEACALYDAAAYRYGANWYGYLAEGRLSTLRSQGKCRSTAAPNALIEKAVANLRVVTVAAETATAKELVMAEKSEELSTIGLFDWAIDELQAAKKTANNSPKINLALAKHYRFKSDNVNALLALAKSYPDYAQMFPEEMGRDEWEIFYPLSNWNEIKIWAQDRGLDRYQVAGVIRQESIFSPRARSGANAYGLMQLLIPTAQSMARKYVSKTSVVTADALFQPPLNIELGTAYMKDQFAKFGRIEYVAVAYNAGPGRVPQWRATLPAEMDEFVEAIPFKETKGYVQGVIRNSAQYRRLYDDNGNFKPNVGTRPLRSEIDSRPRGEFTAEFPEVSVDETTGG